MLDIIIPTLTKSILEITDKIHFEKVSDDDILNNNLANLEDIDYLDHLIKVFESKGDEFRNEIIEAKRKLEEEREENKRKVGENTDDKDNDSFDDDDEDSPDDDVVGDAN